MARCLETKLSFYDVLTLFTSFKSFGNSWGNWHVTCLISNNCPSFHLLWEENLVKHQKDSKYYEHGSLQNFLLLFMFLLTTYFVKNNHIKARIYFIFLKNALNQTGNDFNTKFRRQWKDGKSCYQVRQDFSLFCNLIAIYLSWNRFKTLELPKLPKKLHLKVSGTS